MRAKTFPRSSQPTMNNNSSNNNNAATTNGPTEATPPPAANNGVERAEQSSNAPGPTSSGSPPSVPAKGVSPSPLTPPSGESPLRLDERTTVVRPASPPAVPATQGLGAPPPLVERSHLEDTRMDHHPSESLHPHHPLHPGHLSHHGQGAPQPPPAHQQPHPMHSSHGGPHGVAGSPPEVKSEEDLEEELLLKWDDHHKSFFELAEDLCHNEQFIDVTLSCGDHNFPAHKLILSVCSPYFRHLFIRNPCKHPIVVLKDVHFKYMKLLLMYMYRGEVSCPQEDLIGLLKTARSLQIRGLVELERKRELEGLLTNSVTGSPIKRPPSADGRTPEGASTTSDLPGHSLDDRFSLDDVRSRLHGQLDIQPVSSSSAYQQQLSTTHQPAAHHPQHQQQASSAPAPPPPHQQQAMYPPRSSSTTTHDIISKAVATSSSNDPQGEEPMSEGEEAHHQPLQNGPQNPYNNYSHLASHPHHRKLLKDTQKWAENNGHRSRSPLAPAAQQQRPRSRSRPSAASNAALIAAAQAAGMPPGAIDPSDPMASMNALLAAAQASSPSNTPQAPPAHAPSSGHTHLNSRSPAPSSSSPGPNGHSNHLPNPPRGRGANNSTPPAAAAAALAAAQGGTASGAAQGSNGNGSGVDLSQAAAVANVSPLQLYYYMQKVASSNLGNPKERKECPVCAKTLYDRSTWNRHMRIHTGEKPYPCRFCGRRFRTNYNKLGHEKKCPDRHARALLNQQQAGGAGSAAAGAPGAGAGSSAPAQATPPAAAGEAFK